MNDVYWNSVLQQEGIPEAHLPTTTFEQICTLVASNLTVPTKKSTEIRPGSLVAIFNQDDEVQFTNPASIAIDKVILEPSVRLAATRKMYVLHNNLLLLLPCTFPLLLFDRQKLF